MCTVTLGLAAQVSHRSRSARTHTCYGPSGHLPHGARLHSPSLQSPPRTPEVVVSARLTAAFGGAATRGAGATTCPPSLSAAAKWSPPPPLSSGASLPSSTPKHVGWWPVHEAAVAVAAALWTASRRELGARAGEGLGRGVGALPSEDFLRRGGKRSLVKRPALRPLQAGEDSRGRPFLGSSGRACPTVDRRCLCAAPLEKKLWKMTAAPVSGPTSSLCVEAAAARATGTSAPSASHPRLPACGGLWGARQARRWVFWTAARGGRHALASTRPDAATRVGLSPLRTGGGRLPFTSGWA